VEVDLLLDLEPQEVVELVVAELLPLINVELELQAQLTLEVEVEEVIMEQ
jgi:hypothetical protein